MHVLSTSIGIDNLVVNGLILLVEAFTVLLDHFIFIFSPQTEANCKCDNTNNSENAIKLYQELTIQASTTGVHNCSGFEGALLL
jgi:hypothetical protein